MIEIWILELVTITVKRGKRKGIWSCRELLVQYLYNLPTTTCANGGALVMHKRIIRWSKITMLFVVWINYATRCWISPNLLSESIEISFYKIDILFSTREPVKHAFSGPSTRYAPNSSATCIYVWCSVTVFSKYTILSMVRFSFIKSMWNEKRLYYTWKSQLRCNFESLTCLNPTCR